MRVKPKQMRITFGIIHQSRAIGLNASHDYAPAKLGNVRMMFLNFQNWARGEKCLKDNKQ